MNIWWSPGEYITVYKMCGLFNALYKLSLLQEPILVIPYDMIDTAVEIQKTYRPEIKGEVHKHSDDD